jgi:hypothetical protein
LSECWLCRFFLQEKYIIKKEGYAFNKVIIRQSFIIFTICFGVVFLLTIASSNAYVIEVPPYYGLNVKFRGTASESYSSNITFAEEEEDIVADFVTNMALGLNIEYEGKKRSLGLSGRMNRQIRTRSTDVQNRAEHITVNFLNEFSEYDRIGLINTFSHTQVPGSFELEYDREECERLIDEFGITDIIESECRSLFEEEFGRITGMFDDYENRFTVNYTKHISKELNMNLGYTYGLNWASAEGSEDTNQNNLNLKGTYLHSAITNFLLSYYYSNSRSKNEDSVSTQSVSVGVKRYLTKHLSFNVSTGVSISSSRGNRYVRQDIDFLLENELLIDRKTTGRLKYSRDVRIISDRNELFDNWRISADLRRELLENFSGSISCFYGQGKFLEEGSTDKLLGARISLNYLFWEGKKGQRLSGLMGYTYSNLDSTYEDRGYERTAVNFGLTVGI